MKIKIFCLVLAVAGVAGLIPSLVWGGPTVVLAGALAVSTNTGSGLPVLGVIGSNPPPVISVSNAPSGGAESNGLVAVTNRPVVMTYRPAVVRSEPVETANESD